MLLAEIRDLHFPIYYIKHCAGNGPTSTCGITCYKQLQSPYNSYYLCEVLFLNFSRTVSEMCCFDTMFFFFTTVICGFVPDCSILKRQLYFPQYFFGTVLSYKLHKVVFVTGMDYCWIAIDFTGVQYIVSTPCNCLNNTHSQQRDKNITAA